MTSENEFQSVTNSVATRAQEFADLQRAIATGLNTLTERHNTLCSTAHISSNLEIATMDAGSPEDRGGRFLGLVRITGSHKDSEAHWKTPAIEATEIRYELKPNGDFETHAGGTSYDDQSPVTGQSLYPLYAHAATPVSYKAQLFLNLVEQTFKERTGNLYKAYVGQGQPKPMVRNI